MSSNAQWELLLFSHKNKDFLVKFAIAGNIFSGLLDNFIYFIQALLNFTLDGYKVGKTHSQFAEHKKCLWFFIGSLFRSFRYLQLRGACSLYKIIKLLKISFRIFIETFFHQRTL